MTIIPLDIHNASDVTLQLVGGKGLSLIALSGAGLPVPDGFILSTRAFDSFIESNELQPIIARHLNDKDPAAGARAIEDLFEAAAIPDSIVTAIRQACASLDTAALAVRSSATAEDLPGLSFAGQQASFLNVQGVDAVLESIRHCWASLWSERAVSYRERMAVDQSDLSIAVVVQTMLDAEAAGVLFTANPVSGDRSELIINASWGLGEAVVGGEVAADTHILDRATLSCKETIIGNKATMVVSAADQGTTTEAVAEHRRDAATLTEPTLKELGRLGLKVEALFHNQPQDIEWVLCGDDCWLVQSRPITNLPAPPLTDVSWTPPQGARALLRRQVVENMPEPLSPLFEELYLHQGLDNGMDQMLVELDLPIDIDSFVERPLFVTVNGYGYCRYDLKFSWAAAGMIPRLLLWYLTRLPAFMKSLIPRWQDHGLPEYLSVIDEWQALQLEEAADELLLEGIRQLAYADAKYWFQITMVVGAAKVTEGLLDGFLKSRWVPGIRTSGMLLSGFPSKTLQAQQDLETIAGLIRSERVLRDRVREAPAEELPALLAMQGVGASIAAQLQDYLSRYGSQVYNLDFVAPTQAEDPGPILTSLKALVENPGATTVDRQAAMAANREKQSAEVIAELGRVRRWLFARILRWARKWGPYREEALFYMGAAWPTLRRLALTLGERLAAAGILRDADDVFYLDSRELLAACQSRAAAARRPDLAATELSGFDLAGSDLSVRAQDRRTLRDARKRLHPPGRVPIDVRFKFGPFDVTRLMSMSETQKRNPTDSKTLDGFAVSPGKVTGSACLILSQADFKKMRPDCILVCPTTTPAWTPLFAQARGLVTDIGSILAHGSIVAREYGIPAVLGTGNGTQRISDGQIITVDGNTGVVLLTRARDRAQP